MRQNFVLPQSRAIRGAITTNEGVLAVKPSLMRLSYKKEFWFVEVIDTVNKEDMIKKTYNIYYSTVHSI